MSSVDENTQKCLLNYEKEVIKAMEKYFHEIKSKSSQILSLSANELKKLQKELKLVKCFESVFVKHSKNTMYEFNSEMDKSVNQFAKEIKMNVE